MNIESLNKSSNPEEQRKKHVLSLEEKITFNQSVNKRIDVMIEQLEQGGSVHPYDDHNIWLGLEVHDPEFLSDNGISIPKMILERINEKAFSLKDGTQEKAIFLKTIKRALFSKSPNIFNYLNTFDQLLICSESSLDSDVRGYWGQDMVGEIVYTYNFNKIDTEQLTNQILELPIEKQVNIIHQFSTISAKSRGEMYSAENAVITIQNILNNLLEKTNNRFLKFFIDAQIEKIQDTGNVIGFLTYEGDENGGRKIEHIDDNLIEEDYFIRRNIKQHPDIAINSTYRFIADDYILVSDSANIPKALIKNESLRDTFIKWDKTTEGELRTIDGLSANTLYYTQRFLIEKISDVSYDEAWPQISHLISYLSREIDIWSVLGSEQKKNYEKIYEYDAEIRDIYQNHKENASPEIIEHYNNLHQKQSDLINNIDLHTLIDYIAEQRKELEKDMQSPHIEFYSKENSTLRFLHMHEFIEHIKLEFSIDITAMKLSEQKQFSEFYAHANGEKFNEFKKVFSNPDMDHEKLLRSFLSIDTGGSEMGYKILEVAQKLPTESANAIFEKYVHVLDKSKTIHERLNKGLKGLSTHSGVSVLDFSNQLQSALVIRAKDILLTTHTLIEKPGDEQKIEMQDYINALAGFELSLDIINDLESKESFNYKRISQNNEVNRFIISDKTNTHSYDVKFLTRPYAEADNKAQARLSMEISFDTDKPHIDMQKAFYQEITYHSNDQKKIGSSFRLALDLDMRLDSENPVLSLDTGRGELHGKKISRTGDTLGNAFGLISKDSSHLQGVFDDTFNNPDTFAHIVTKIQKYINAL